MGRSSHARRLPGVSMTRLFPEFADRIRGNLPSRVLNIEIISRREVTVERMSISESRRECSRQNVRNGDIGRRFQHRLLPIKLTPRVEGYSNYYYYTTRLHDCYKLIVYD